MEHMYSSTIPVGLHSLASKNRKFYIRQCPKVHETETERMNKEFYEI